MPDGILPFHDAKLIGEDLLVTLNTPFVLSVLCDLDGQPYYTAWVKASPDHMSVFVVGILETMIDHGSNDDEVLQALELMRTHVKKHGGNLRPATQKDFQGEPTDETG